MYVHRIAEPPQRLTMPYNPRISLPQVLVPQERSVSSTLMDELDASAMLLTLRFIAT